MKHPRLVVVVLLITAVLAGEWAWLRLRDRPASDSAASAVPVGAAIPGGPFALTDHLGKPVSSGDFAGGLLLIVFGYTYCPDVCPTTLLGVASALDLLGEQAARIQPLFVTIDPMRDTPEVLAAYVAAFHPRLVGLTGSAAQIKRMAGDYRVYYARVGPEDGDYFMDHSAFIYLVGADGRPLAYFPHDLAPEDLAARVRAFLDGTV
jgi:protein SCO1/2